VGCPSGGPSPLPDPRFYPTNCFPYVANNQTMQSYITATNRSLQWGMDLKVTFRDVNGAVVHTFQKRLNAAASDRFSPPSGFVGSAVVEGVGAQFSLASQVELRALSGQGAALSGPAYDPQPSSMMMWPSVVDAGPGTDRTQVATLNQHGDIPLYIEFDHLADADCSDDFEAKVNPWSIHTFHPAQMFPDGAASGVQDFEVHGAGWTGPGRTGTADGGFSGALLTTGANVMALHNYLEIWRWSWPPYAPSEDHPQLYYTDVEDDGVNRADRLYVKFFSGESTVATQYNIHFYDENGGETKKTIILVRHLEYLESTAMIEPMKLLGKPFKGSVWLETRDPMQTAMRRVAPGKWTDLSAGGPAGCPRPCIIPYATSKDDKWKYELVLFHPATIYPPPDDPLAEPPPPITHGGPGIAAPPAGQRVVLRFYDLSGSYRGWVAVHMLENQTKRLTLAQVASYLGGPIEGSVQVEPFVVVELAISHINGQAHASMNPWWTGQY